MFDTHACLYGTQHTPLIQKRFAEAYHQWTSDMDARAQHVEELQGKHTYCCALVSLLHAACILLRIGISFACCMHVCGIPCEDNNSNLNYSESVDGISCFHCSRLECFYYVITCVIGFLGH